ncbi:hypothetical protein GCM10009634_49030 [Saccharothrix xinjiangensis]
MCVLVTSTVDRPRHARRGATRWATPHTTAVTGAVTTSTTSSATPRATGNDVTGTTSPPMPLRAAREGSR